MTDSRLVPILSAALLLSLLTSPALAAERSVILDGGTSWAALADGALDPLPMPDGDVVLHKAVEMSQGRLATGIELTERDGTSVERLLVVRVADEQMDRLPAPEQLHDSVTYSPTPVVTDGELSGLVWIEGFAPNRTRVMASDWTGSGWTQPVAVSNFGAGTQIALDLVRLGDGSLLAVWAAFDGEDDEIVWSRSRADGVWSTPRPLTDNSVPDVTPSLLATKDGAVVAWSGYDGKDYRIQLSRLALDAGAEGAWSAPLLLEGRGGVWPQFQPTDDTAVLTWRQAVPRTWMAAALDGETLLWTLPAPQPPAALRGRPLAEMSKEDGGMHLLWPIASADGVAKTEQGAETLLAQTVVEPPEG